MNQVIETECVWEQSNQYTTGMFSLQEQRNLSRCNYFISSYIRLLSVKLWMWRLPTLVVCNEVHQWNLKAAFHVNLNANHQNSVLLTVQCIWSNDVFLFLYRFTLNCSSRINRICLHARLKNTFMKEVSVVLNRFNYLFVLFIIRIQKYYRIFIVNIIKKGDQN